MPTVSLPDNPSLEHLRGQARRLQRAVREAGPEAIALVKKHGVEPASDFKLSQAQFVVAKACGFSSWPRVVEYFDVVAAYRWDPEPANPEESIPDAYVRLACLMYDDGDSPERWAAARRLLAEHPAQIAANPWSAAAAGLETAVGGVGKKGGPYGCTPLFYLAYSRGQGGDPVEVARRLLNAGADPNEGYLWRGLPTPFTVLTGVFGGGERSQPPHPDGRALAQLLLDAGADPNDGQALYNRMFTLADDHLELLFAAGLGTGTGGPWRQRLGDASDTPTEMLHRLLEWAVSHGQTARVRLMLANGVDPNFRFPDGRTPAERALLNGYPEIAELLPGTEPPSPADAYVGAALTANYQLMDALEAANPGLARRVRTARPGLIVWAAGSGRLAAVKVLLERGYDVNAKGRADTPIEQEWETALHAAVSNDDEAMARHLLAAGADRTIHDARFDATPLDWAHHLGRPRLAALLTV